MSLDAINAAASAVAEAWPYPDTDALNAVADSISGKEEERHQRVLAAVLRALQRSGPVVWHHASCGEGLRGRWTHWASLGAQAGTPDVIVAFPRAVVVWVEDKSAKGTLRAAQEKARDRLREAGHHHIVPRSVGEAVGALAEIWREHVQQSPVRR